MFSTFSRGYYVGRLYVTPRDGDRPVMQRQLHEQVNEQLFADDDGISRLDTPLVMKLGTHHLAVHGEEDVPTGTLAVPEETLEAADVRNPPSREEVLLAKSDLAARLLGLGGGPDRPAGV